MTSSRQKTAMIILMIMATYPAMSQSWLPQFLGNVGTEKLVSRAQLDECLAFLHTSDSESCRARMSVFYFRVNHKGMVDSLYSEGNFKPAERKNINQNILRTSGYWIVPPGTKSTDRCWFVFPCFTIGRMDKDCPDEQWNSRQLLILRNSLAQFAFQRDAKGRYLLPPNRYVRYARNIR